MLLESVGYVVNVYPPIGDPVLQLSRGGSDPVLEVERKL